jgi:transposase
MWTEITRRKYEREGPRYASDVTDAEWTLIEPHMPAVKPLGRPREIELRAVLGAILYIARTGCQWRMLPKDFPPFTTVQGYFYDWRDNGLFETPCSTFCGRRVRGVYYRAIFRNGRQCSVSFMRGRRKGCGKRSISCWSNMLGSGMAAKPAPRPA